MKLEIEMQKVTNKTRILFASILWVSLARGASLQPHVTTPLGEVEGRTVYFEGIPLATYQGVPFAEPPVGELRFKKPQPIRPWSGALRAQSLPPGCIQFSPKPFPFADSLPGLSEDCLYLNIWVPVIGSDDTANNLRNLPVMFFIHGGVFSIGSSRLDFYDGRVLAALGDVIVVTTNYRLGPQAFLYSGTDDAPGNMGLHDILVSLKWVKSNIQSFGGDPEKITVFGQSAGAIAISMLMTSPLARNLFVRAILTSGSAANLEAEDKDLDFELSEKLARRVGCVTNKANFTSDPNGVVGCLRSIDGLTLVKEAEKASYKRFYPRFGDDILPNNARQSLIDGEFESHDVLIGCVRDEGSQLITSNFQNVFGGRFGEIDAQINKIFGEQMIREIFATFQDPDAVIRHYLGGLDEYDFEKVRYQVYTAAGDKRRLCPSIYLAERLAERSRVFFYFFTHRPSPSPYAPWMGVVHIDDTPFFFGYPLRYAFNYTQPELDLSRRMVQIWTDFAKTGLTEPAWPLYSRGGHQYQTLDTNSNGIRIGPRLSNCEFYRPYFGF